jgi:hypothetical protein
MSVLVNVSSNDLSQVLNQSPIQIRIYDNMTNQSQYTKKIIDQLNMLYPQHRDLITKVFKKNVFYSNMSKGINNKITSCSVNIS